MPRVYIKKGTRSGEVNEEAMKCAIKEVLDKTLSVRKSAVKYGLKPSTLETRIKKHHKNVAAEETARVFKSKYTSNQVFTIEEESILNKYITDWSKMHYGLTTIQVRKLAFEFANANKLQYPPTWNHNKMAGKDWLDSFRRRNTNLSLRKPENTSAARSYGFNKTAVNDFFGNLEKVLTKYELNADRIYNFDESGISTVMATPKVLAEKSQKQIGQLVSAERGELVTFGGIISASGNTIPPLFIFPRVHFKDHFMAGAPEGSLGVATKSGWINSSIFLEVLKHIHKKTCCCKENPILLLVDNHESHVTIEAVDYARDNGIIYMSFPPHTTHRLQPLDVGVFGPFKAKLKTAFNDWHVNNPGKTLNIYNIPKLAKLAYFESFTCKNIASAFEKTGIWPFNKLAFSDEDFAPVQVYQTESTAGPDVNVQLIVEEGAGNTQQDSPPASPSILSQPIDAPSTSAAGLITPDMIRPYPKVVRSMQTKLKKGKMPGKSRIYTDTPEKNRLEEIEKDRQTKKKEQERRQRAKEMKRALHLLSETSNIIPKTKPKRQKKTVETDTEDETDISLRESSCSPIEEMSAESDIESETPVMTGNIQEGSFVLVKFEKKKTVKHYVGKVVAKHSPFEYKVSFLRKKPGTWKFIFPTTLDEGTMYLSDIVCLLPPTETAFTTRTASIYSFKKDLSVYNVQ
ncbi:hypothetical protein JYU34_015655 [Plutella xylostella]|uniref:HTH CENPB-type domain-containing protein n=1 Tax=Plutella xylostella TaxID=51655 RepID=A0ABQ7Q4P9_PLUXY|nr:hypothetical protein JYU34_015655 [Plutella xylostella]